ncbi:hypothetical protein C7U89_30020 [Bradyrhizobium sp. WBOS4]|nr:hypothetical protein [Bradyrhizobium sp. WBOS4]
MLRKLLRMRLSSMVPVETPATHPVLILRARQRRASRRMATGEISPICDCPGLAREGYPRKVLEMADINSL